MPASLDLPILLPEVPDRLHQQQLHDVTEKEAVKMMTDIDKRRMANYNFYTDQKWGKATNYTLTLNSSELGYEMCEKIIMECVKNLDFCEAAKQNIYFLTFILEILIIK